MNQLTKLFALIILMAFASNTYAQSFILKGGLNSSSMTLKDDDGNYSDEAKQKLGYHLGAGIEFSLAESFALETGLMVQTAGFATEEILGIKSSINLLYITVPILAKPKFSLNEKTNIFLVAGPYLGYGLSAKAVFKFAGERESEDIEWGDEGLDRLDYGVNIGAGVELLGNLQIGVGYALGLANLVPSDDPLNTVSQNRNLLVTVGWRFGE